MLRQIDPVSTRPVQFYDYQTSLKEIRQFLVHSFQNFQEMLKKCFFSTTSIVINVACSYFQSHRSIVFLQCILKNNTREEPYLKINSINGVPTQMVYIQYRSLYIMLHNYKRIFMSCMMLFFSGNWRPSYWYSYWTTERRTDLSWR